MSIIKGYLVPHQVSLIKEVGGEDFTTLNKTTTQMLEIAEEIKNLAPDTIIILSPHSSTFSDYFQIGDGELGLGSFKSYGAPQVAFRAFYDKEFVKTLHYEAASRGFPAGVDGEQRSLEHGIMVPLYYLNFVYSNYKIVRVGLSGLPLIDHYNLGVLLKDIASRLHKRVVVLASGDGVHINQGEENVITPYEKEIGNIINKGNFGQLLSYERKTLKKYRQCLHRPLTTLAGCFDRTDVQGEVRSFERPLNIGLFTASITPVRSDSSRAFGEYYLAKEKLRIADIKNEEDDFTKLARNAVETFLKTGKTLKAPDLLSFKVPARGCFINIKEKGEIRGNIGTIYPKKETLGQEIIFNALGAAFSDPRFQPIEKEDLPYLEYEVYVLSPLEKVNSEKNLDPKVYGIAVRSNDRQAVLLPDLPGIETVSQQITAAKQKAGIKPLERAAIFRFTVERHH